MSSIDNDIDDMQRILGGKCPHCLGLESINSHYADCPALDELIGYKYIQDPTNLITYVMDGESWLSIHAVPRPNVI